jgi:hypothetical protein
MGPLEVKMSTTAGSTIGSLGIILQPSIPPGENDGPLRINIAAAVIVEGTKDNRHGLGSLKPTNEVEIVMQQKIKI